MSTDVNTAYHRRSAAPSNEYRSFPVRSVKPTHDGRSVEGAGGASSSVSGGAGLDSTRRPSDATTSATPVVAPLNQPTVVPLPVVEQQPRAHGTPRRGDSPYRGSTGVEEESRRQATPRRQQAVQIINLENFEAFPNANVKTVFNSPRSLSVCAEHGIHATELLPRAPQDFLSTAVPETIAAMRYHHFEARRQEKLALLRAARADAIHAAAVAAAAELVRELDATEHEDDANATAQVVTRAAVVPSASFLRTPARIGTSTPPATVRAAVSRRPVLSSGGASTTNTALRHDPTVLVERASKRELVYERAMKLRLEQEQRVIQNQIQAEQRAVSHRKACEEEKARVIELRRLKWGDAREEIEHKRRQREYQERRRREQFIASNGSIPFRRSSSCSQPASSQQATTTTTTSSRTNQHVDVTATVFADLSYTGVLQERRNQQRAWDVQLAKEQYFTPRQRAEKVRRASSAHAAV